MFFKFKKKNTNFSFAIKNLERMFFKLKKTRTFRLPSKLQIEFNPDKSMEV